MLADTPPPNWPFPTYKGIPVVPAKPVKFKQQKTPAYPSDVPAPF